MISGPYLEACMVANPEAAFGGTSRLLGLIETIYAAVQRPALWPRISRKRFMVSRRRCLRGFQPSR
jgi:hypothetical protein